MQQITLDQLRSMSAAGGIRSVTLMGDDGAFCIRALTQRGEEALLMTQRGNTRRFAHINKAAAMLKEMGIEDVLLSLQNWEPEQSQSGRVSRPDRSEAMKRAHEAAAYDAWFHEQVDTAISEADDPATVWVGDDNASASWVARRAELLKRIAGGAD